MKTLDRKTMDKEIESNKEGKEEPIHLEPLKHELHVETSKMAEKAKKKLEEEEKEEEDN